MQRPEGNSEILKRGIVLGSHARHENSEYSSLELIDLIPIVVNGVIENFTVVNMVTEEQTLLSRLNNFELIFDADTLDPIRLEILYKAKKYLLDNLHGRVLNCLKNNILAAYQGILDQGLYRYKSENVYQYNIENETFFVNLNSRKSVKYTYLRFFQNIILYLILRDKNLAFQYLDLSPDLHSKLELLLSYKVVMDTNNIESIYFKLVDIYNYGLNALHESTDLIRGVIYVYPGSKQILLEANTIARNLVLNLADES